MKKAKYGKLDSIFKEFGSLVAKNETNILEIAVTLPTELIGLLRRGRSRLVYKIAQTDCLLCVKKLSRTLSENVPLDHWPDIDTNG